jgi:hypothetical protein
LRKEEREMSDTWREHWSADQRERAVALLEQIPWGDMEVAICGLEDVLRIALEATTEDFWRWEERIGPEIEAGGFDEYSMPPEMIGGMSDGDRLAHVARLLRSLALTYGVSAEFGIDRGGLVGEAGDPRLVRRGPPRGPPLRYPAKGTEGWRLSRSS